MSIFESIKNAIFGHGTDASASAAAQPTSALAPTPAGTTTPTASAAPTVAPPTLSSSDLDAQLTALSAKNPQKLNWQTSIVDLMKLVGLDASLTNRKTLAHELGYTGDTNDSASMNIWLHKAVMEKLAQSGGKVPESLRA